MSFFKKAFHSVSHAVGSVTHAITKPVSSGVSLVGKLEGHIPVVGKPLKSITDLTVGAPLRTLDSVARGARIDKALSSHFREQLVNVKDVAPYAQIVVSQVPVIGTSASAAISAGLNLASGRNITDAVSGAIRDNIPGAARMYYDQAQAVVAAAGNDIKQPLESALSKLKDDNARSAFRIGTAVATARRVQGLAGQIGGASKSGLETDGKRVADADPVLSAGASVFQNQASKSGYYIGLSANSHKGPSFLRKGIYSALSADQKLGYTIAAAVLLGKAEYFATSNLVAPREQFGFYAACGLSHSTEAQAKAALELLSHDTSVLIGIHAAATKMKNKGWWHKILVSLGIRSEAA